MTCAFGSGFGAGSFGTIPFGVGGGEALALIAVDAVRENVVRFSFNREVYFSGILDSGDASDPRKYSIAPYTDTVGNNGLPAREVMSAATSLATDIPNPGTAVDVTLDRPLSPYPAQYAATVQNIRVPEGEFIDDCFVSVNFDGVYRTLQPQGPSFVVETRDIAMPQTRRDLSQTDGATLRLFGTYGVDSTGDYAFDSGLACLRKRVLRRLMTTMNGFTFLNGYGVGLPGLSKKLNAAATRQKFASEAERQIALEPEVQKVSVSFSEGPKPGLVYVVVRIRTRQGIGYRFEVPLPSNKA